MFVWSDTGFIFENVYKGVREVGCQSVILIIFSHLQPTCSLPKKKISNLDYDKKNIYCFTWEHFCVSKLKYFNFLHKIRKKNQSYRKITKTPNPLFCSQKVKTRHLKIILNHLYFEINNSKIFTPNILRETFF